MAGPRAAFGLAAGAGWNLANVVLLSILMGTLSDAGPDRHRRLVRLLAAKFALLYPAGIGLLWFGAAPAGPFALGFTLVLAGVAGSAALPGRVETSSGR